MYTYRPPSTFFIRSIAFLFKYIMKFLEKEIEDFLFHFLKDSNEEKLNDLTKRGMYLDVPISMKFNKQVDLSPYGIADIVGLDLDYYASAETLHVSVCVIELKKDSIGYNALGQAYRYLTAIDNSIINSTFNSPLIKQVSKNYQIALVGTEADLGNDFCYLQQNVENVNCYIASFDPTKGIVFKRLGHYEQEGRKSVNLEALESMISQLSIETNERIYTSK